MHREISHAEQAFEQESRLSLYLLTGLLGLLIALDLWPAFANWEPMRGLGLPKWPREVLGFRIALIAAVIGGARTLYGSLESLFDRRIGADLALAIAAIAAILVGEPLVAAEIVFIGMIGECLESFTFERTQRAIRHLVEICPRRCWLLRDGQEVRVRTSELQVGDKVVVKPGGRVPVDGVVIDGRSAVDVSALTGETMPADKSAGDEILAGSLNQFGALTIEARRVAEHTVVGRVIELTARALKDKAKLERTADRLAKYFLPIVLGLAALTFLVTVGYRWATLLPGTGRFGMTDLKQSVYPALSVLVVACPCALILATPAAIIAALGRLAGTGVLIKGGSALERLAEVEAFAFDKTGTLTEGRLELGDVIGLNGVASDELLRVAATAEQRSEHLLARLIIQEAAQRQLPLTPVEEFLAHPGAGITARAEGATLVVGSRRLLEEQGIALPQEVHGLLEKLDADGQTALLVARDGEILGVIGARDRLRPEAQAVVNELRALGIHRIALLTGDRLAVAKAIATALNITEVHAELLPEQKAQFIEQWRKGTASEEPSGVRTDPSDPLAHHVTTLPRHSGTHARHRVAMVGDGINDAPALACADVGLAIGSTGTDVAAEAGDVVFMGDPLRALPLLVRLSRETVRIIQQNILIFAFGVNGVGILLTAWLWPLFAPKEWYEQSPVAAVIYHQLGSLAVLLNAMRLLWFERTATSLTWQRLRGRLQGIDSWMEHYFNLDEMLHWLGHRWRAVAGGAAGVLLGGYLLWGFVQVGPDEVAVVRRFGQLIEPDLEPGLHWRFPWPIDEITRVKPGRVNTVELGFRSTPGKAAPSTTLTWSNPHSGDGVRRVSDEAVMITGDGNLVELQATIHYTIDRPHVYLFEVNDPETVLRSTAESVLREVVGSRTLVDLLTVERERFQQDVLDRVRNRCDEYGPDGLGIHVTQLSLHDIHPPQEVVEDYHRVTNAMQIRDKLINQAQAEAMEKERAAQSQAQKIVREAEASRFEKRKNAEAAQAVFLARYNARTQLSSQQEWVLMMEALAAASEGMDPTEAYKEYERRRRDALALQAALTDFRLYWDALGRALAGREKLLIDAEKVPGRRHLLLVDPSEFRIPAPILPGTLPPRTNRPAKPGEDH